MEFVEVQRLVFGLYGKGSYEEGLEVIAAARPLHPDRDGRLTFWEACLLGMSGRPQEALGVLEKGLDRGLWWASGVLADSDLDSVRTLPEWAEVSAQSEMASAKAAPLRPDPRVRPASTETPSGTLITLHGAGADPAAHAQVWEEATPESWVVVTPAGDVSFAPGEWAWHFDLTPSPLADHLDGVDLEPPLILTGWSQGGGMAASIAWSGGLEVEGLLLFGPGFRGLEWNPDAHSHIPTVIVIGENDFNLTECVGLGDRMAESGVVVRLDVLPGKAHELPDDLGQAIIDGLEWLLREER